MPAKEKNGMQNFVASRGGMSNAARPNGASGGFDDLRADVPMKPGGNTMLTASNHATTNIVDKARYPPAHGHRDSNGPKTFYDTDTASLGVTSATESASLANGDIETAGTRHHHRVVRDDELASDEEWDSEGEHPEGEPEDDDLTDNPLGAHQKPARSPQPDSSGEAKKPNGSVWPYIKGDSYPTTTDGVPSESDHAGNGRTQNAQQPTPAPPAPTIHLPQRGPRQLPGGLAQNQPSSRARSPNKQAGQHGYYKNRSSANQAHTQTEPILEVPFSYSQPSMFPATQRGPLPAHRAQPGPPTALHNASQHQSVPPSATNVTQVGSGSLIPDPRSQQHASSRLNHHIRIGEPTAKQQHSKAEQTHESRPAIRLDHITAETERAPFSHQSVAYPPRSEEVIPRDSPRDDRPPTELPMQLDYDVPALYDMEYEDLKAADFDDDPKADGFSLQGDSFDHQMHTAVNLDSADQQGFFATLDIDEWEEAGEWFLARFGNIVGKLKDARQAKRKAARAFENEVEHRHGAVRKKRKLTEAALSKMKQSGAAVLQGTPKKAKKTD